VLAFDAPDCEPPPAVVLDTNVVAAALLPNEPEHSACLAVLERRPDGARTIEPAAVV